MKTIPASVILFGAFMSAAALAAPAGFENPVHPAAPAEGHDMSNMRKMTIDEVKKFSYDEQVVSVEGKLVAFKGGDWYILQDARGDQMYIELNKDKPWSEIAKDQLIDVIGAVDRDNVSVTLYVIEAVPAKGS